MGNGWVIMNIYKDIFVCWSPYSITNLGPVSYFTFQVPIWKINVIDLPLCLPALSPYNDTPVLFSYLLYICVAFYGFSLAAN